MASDLTLSWRENDVLKWWRGVVDSLPFYVLLVDEDHHIVAWNQTMSQEYGGIVPNGAYCPELVHGQSQPYAGCPLETAVEVNAAVEKELWDAATGHWVSSAVYPTGIVTLDGRRVYLHFARDITAEKKSQLELAQSLEHHKALGQLLQRYAQCTKPADVFQCLIDTTLELSWMRDTCGAAAFLANAEQLDLVYSRDLERPVEERCARVAFGHCLCGRVASERRAIVTGDHAARQLRVLNEHGHDNRDHGHAVFPLQYEGRTLGVVNFYVHSEIRLEASQRSFLDAAIGVTTSAVGQLLSRAAAHESEQRASALERKLLEMAIQSQEDERKRVARELHDDLGQALSALLLDIRTMAQDDGHSAAEICSRMDHEVRGLVSRVSSLAWDLRPAVLDDLGLDSALSRHISNVAKRAQLNIDYQYIPATPNDPRLPNSVEIVLYRVTQESLNNIVKYAKATRVSVLVYRRADSVVLVVEDDGVGFDVATMDKPKAGLGLLGMRERANLLKGTLLVESTPGAGTIVKATLPIAHADLTPGIT